MAPLPPRASAFLLFKDLRDRVATVEANADLCQQLDQRLIHHSEQDGV
jgi:hypothetical protein